LLALEKHRRNLPPDSLVFVSMHDVAQFWWCPMYAVRKNQKFEVEFFGAYLQDRIDYAQRLGLLKAKPRTATDILAIGADITLLQVESLFLGTRSVSVPQVRPKNAQVQDGREQIGSEYSSGKRAQAEFAEVYGTFRWNFPWKEFTVVGVPDGLSADLVYEFKSTKNRRGLDRTMRIASTQADLYGLFFNRQRKRVQVLVMEDECVETLDAVVDHDNAVFVLERVRSIAHGEVAQPPESFKCRFCDVAEGCPIRQI
jgi:hypothetical protein